MPLEIEAKMLVDLHEPIIARLKALQAEHVGRLLETNVYLDTPQQSLRAENQGLRVRHEQNLDAGTARTIITHKGPRHEGQLKTRPETELEVDNLEDALAMLAVLGYQPLLKFNKRRDRWKLDNCTVELDEIPALGRFIEIEGPDDQAVFALREKLGLSGLPLESRSYLRLLVERIEAGQLTESDLIFE